MRARVVFALAAAGAALTGTAAQDRQTPPTFRTAANYVRVDAYATRDGVPVTDLRADEVEVLEDGRRETVVDFEHVLVRPAGVGQARDPGGLGASREQARDPRARVFVIFLDTYHTSLVGSAKVREPLAQFLDRLLGPDDLVALMTPEMGGSDIALGRETTVIASILREQWWGRAGQGGIPDPKELLYEQCYGREIAREMIARRREKLTLDALEDLNIHLNGLRDERKAVIVVSEGWMLFQPSARLAAAAQPPATPIFRPPVAPPSDTGTITQARQVECEADRAALAEMDSEARLRGITGDANRNNVTFYPVDPNGLSPLEPANRTRQASLRAIAFDTDGEAIVNTNNIGGMLKRIADDLSSYYLIGYYSSNGALDGRFRSISVRVTRPGVTVRARRGYRARMPADVTSTPAAADPADAAMARALGVIVSATARSDLRLRTSPAGGQLWVVGELDSARRREPVWRNGAEAEVSVRGGDGRQVLVSRVPLRAGQGSFALRAPASGTIPPGEYSVRVRLRPASGGDAELIESARAIVPEGPSMGDPILWRRGPSTGPQFVHTADPRFSRTERIRLEFAASGDDTPTARVLDRTGQPLAVPVRIDARVDADGTRWFVAELALAALAAGDYAIELVAGASRRLVGLRIG